MLLLYVDACERVRIGHGTSYPKRPVHTVLNTATLRADRARLAALLNTEVMRDLSLGKRSFEEVQKRGRWTSSESVQRYARPHAWHAAEARQPEPVVALGRRWMAARGCNWKEADFVARAEWPLSGQ